MQNMPVAIVETAPVEIAPFHLQEAAERYRLPEGFGYLDEEAPGIRWDAKYAGSDNFTGAPVDGYEADRVAVSFELASALLEAQRLARAEGLDLLVWDAARPQRAVDRFVAWSKESEDGLTKEAHYPNLDKRELIGEYVARRSGHSRGGAVDLTLTDAEGEPLDMGGAFDLMDARSHHGAKGLTRAQTKRRALLRRIMKQAGFKAYESEWWHYSLKDEPFPGQYFDFAIGETRPMPATPDERTADTSPTAE